MCNEIVILIKNLINGMPKTCALITCYMFYASNTKLSYSASE